MNDHPARQSPVTILQRTYTPAFFKDAALPVFVNRPVVSGDIMPHNYEFFQITCVVRGTGTHTTVYGQRKLQRGTAFVITSSDTWHAYGGGEDLVVYNCCFGRELLHHQLAWLRDDAIVASLLAGQFGPRHMIGITYLDLPESTLEVCCRSAETIRTLLADPVEPIQVHVTAQLTAMLAHVGTAAVNQWGLGSTRMPHPAVAGTLALLDQRIADDWSLDSLAEHAHLEKSYFVRLFKRHTGYSPMQYLLALRLDRAAGLLMATDMPVADIARQVGLPEPAYFARRFRMRFDDSPSHYRRSHMHF